MPIVAHFSACFGAPARLWRDHVYLIDGDPITAFTTGMSAHPMTVDASAEGASRHAELMLRLPHGWPIAQGDWPLRWLDQLSRLPHDQETWLAPGHTIPVERVADDVPFTGFLIAPPTSLTEAESVIVTPDRTIAIYAIYPLHPDEIAYKLAHGARALVDRLDDAGVTDEISPTRASVAPR